MECSILTIDDALIKLSVLLLAEEDLQYVVETMQSTLGVTPLLEK